MKRVLILHNQVAPYRLPIFEEINGKFDVTVYFCELKSRDRLWKTDLLREYSFKWKIMGGKRVGNIILTSPKLLIEALKGNWDAYLIADNSETIPATLMIITGALLRGKPVVIWSEKVDSPWNTMLLKRSPWKRALLNLWDRIVFSVSNIIIAYSRKALEYLWTRGIPPGKARVGTQVIPEEVLPGGEATMETGKLKGCRRIFLYLGYLRPEKNVENLIKTFLEVKGDACLLIVGTGPLRERLEKLYSSERIVFYGYAREEEKPNLYRMSEILVLPTLRDSWGLVVNEALYYGTPVITTDAAGASMIIEEGKTGFVVKAGDSREIKKRIEELLNNPKIVKKMKAITRRAGRRYADKKLGARVFIKALNDLLVDS